MNHEGTPKPAKLGTFTPAVTAGAMIFVVVEELIPESQRNEDNIDIVTLSTMLGFSVMMVLDVALG